MCTAVLSIDPDLPVLLAGIRDELTDRAWEPPARHWPHYPELTGGRDLLAGGTWLAVAPGQARASCVLNARGRAADPRSRGTRGELPLRAAAGQHIDTREIGHLDPFHLLTAEPGRAIMQSWDGDRLSETELGPGLHFVVNSGLASGLALAPNTSGSVNPDAGARQAVPAAPDGREIELARIAHFVPRFRDAARPAPRPGQPLAVAWGEWLTLVNGDGLEPEDPRALLVRRTLPDGRIWGTTSVSLVALWPQASRYDFCGTPGDPAAWGPVPL
jgi:hypothetical protein